MAITINDKKIDEELEKIVERLKDVFGINNASKVDAIRFILNIRKQGKKTSKKWRSLFD